MPPTHRSEIKALINKKRTMSFASGKLSRRHARILASFQGVRASRHALPR